MNTCKSRILLIATALALGACGDRGDSGDGADGGPDTAAPEPAAESRTTTPEAAPAADDLESRLADASRAEADRARDAGRKPAEVLAFLGIEPGMSVLDLMAGGGYYTEVLSLAVGPEGQVVAHNTDAALQVRDGANEKALTPS